MEQTGSAAQLAMRLSNGVHDSREAVLLMLVYFVPKYPSKVPITLERHRTGSGHTTDRSVFRCVSTIRFYIHKRI